MKPMQRLWIVIAIASLAMASPAAAQSRKETLADIRQELSIVYVEVQRLKRELSTTGAPSNMIGGNTPLQRLDAIEAALQDLTAKTEELELRINRVVKDGTNRIGDLEFRLVELEGGDVSQLPENTTLGGVSQEEIDSSLPVQPGNDGPELAVGEQLDFDRAKATFDAGDFQQAADQLDAYTQTYPGGALSAQAYILRGEALEKLGNVPDAARSYLNSFSGDPEGAYAPKALFHLGASLGDLGKTKEACVTLGEVETRFPDSDVVNDARLAMQNLGCS